MKKIYISIAILLVAGIASALWYAERPSVTITYGPMSETSEVHERVEDVVIDAPQSGTASQEPRLTENAPTTEEPREAGPACESVRISIESATYMPCIHGTVTVLSAMQSATEDGLVFSGREYPGLGFFIETINGKTGENGYYWFLYINDESSSAGASQALASPGDVIEWRYKQSY